MHSPSALAEHVSLNLAGTFLLDPVHTLGLNPFGLLPASHLKILQFDVFKTLVDSV